MAIPVSKPVSLRHKDTVDAAMHVLHGMAFEPSDGPFGPGQTERCVETLWAAQTLSANLRPGRRVLDIGFTMAHPDYLELLAAYIANGGTVEGVDIIKPERVARRYPPHLREMALSTPVHIADIRTLDLPPASFDAVMCISTLEHVGLDAPSDSANTAFDRPLDKPQDVTRDPATDLQCLQAFARLLKPGGELCLTVPAGEGGIRHIRDRMGLWASYLEYGPADWDRLVTADEFVVDDITAFIETEHGWEQPVWFDGVFEMSVAETGFPTGCIMARLRKL